eukprot:9087184-Prorocentrum_lima.AAC.1
MRGQGRGGARQCILHATAKGAEGQPHHTTTHHTPHTTHHTPHHTPHATQFHTTARPHHTTHTP